MIIMDFFGFKSRKVYGRLKNVILSLLMMLIPCIWAQENIPSFNITCDSTGLFVKIVFSAPFNGISYAKGYRFDPLCSLTKSSALVGSLTLPLTACGTYVQETNFPWITNTVVIQQHPWVRSEDDFEKSVICSLPRPIGNFSSSSILFDQIHKPPSSTPTMSSSDVELRLKVFHDAVDTFDYGKLTIFELLNGTIYNDIGVKNCIADNNASLHQIPNPEICFTVNSDNSSRLTIHYIEGEIIAYVKTKTFDTESLDFYLRCEVFLCKTKCSCSEIDQQTELSTSVINHKLAKRSTDTSSEMFSLKQYEARTRYLKSTVKALMDNIMKQRKQNDKKSKVKKRVMRLDDSSFLSETNSSGAHAITSTEIFAPEPLITEFQNIEPHLRDLFDDSEPHVNDESDYSETNSKDVYDYSDSNESHDFKETVFSTTEIIPVDYDLVVVTLPKELKENHTEIVSDDKLQEKGLVVSNNVGSSSDTTTENMKTTTAISIYPNVVGEKDHLDNCVPRLRFVIVIVAMGFFIGCLLLVTCGMVLYIRKEKKRNRLNDFLLYSIGF